MSWTFTDLSNAEVFEFEVGPSQISLPAVRKAFKYTVTDAQGRALAYEEVNDPQTLSLTGVTLTQAQFGDLEGWCSRNHKMRLEDDLGQTWDLIIQSFAPKRKRNVTHPWAHDYTIECLIVE
jgi:phytoene dehydrogenase-like protein